MLFVCYSEEDRRFFAEAMQSQTVDVIKRMREISAVMNLPGEVLEAQGITAEELEGTRFVAQLEELLVRTVEPYVHEQRCSLYFE